jgi:hypothetical protein
MAFPCDSGERNPLATFGKIIGFAAPHLFFGSIRRSPLGGSTRAATSTGSDEKVEKTLEWIPGGVFTLPVYVQKYQNPLQLRSARY